VSVDLFSVQLFEEAKRLLEKYQESHEKPRAYLHAALVLGMCSLEGHVNSICEEFLVREDLSPWEESILAERNVDFHDGEFTVGNRLKIQRLEDRLLFLHKRFSNNPIDRSGITWNSFLEAVDLRNKLVHPKDAMTIQEDQVKRALLAVVGILDSLFFALYKQGYPAAKRGLQSTMSF
jgi:hypothetical protein